MKRMAGEATTPIRSQKEVGAELTLCFPRSATLCETSDQLSANRDGAKKPRHAMTQENSIGSRNPRSCENDLFVDELRPGTR